jgi:RNA polymerase sigma factor (sigma-70 family)
VVSTTLLLTVARLANASVPDGDLLKRFTERLDEQAFEELVRRHGPLVWSVCRHLLPQHADAEDAFQAVFLALVQRADSVRVGKTLPAWLHGVAVRVAARVKRDAVRRQRRELRASVPEADRSVPDGTWSALLTAVHEEVQQLPDAERTAFVLCDLEGVRQPDAAARLGWPLGTLTGRLCKARKRLLDRLTRRGIGPAVLALGGLAGSAGTVPAALLKMVSSFPATTAGVSSTVANLARGLVEGVTMRTKILAVTLLVCGVLGVAGGALKLSQANAQQPTATTGAGVGEVAEPAPENPQPALGSGGGMAPPGLGGAAHPVWEYKFVDGKRMDRETFEKDLVQLGAEGWEFVASERLRGANDQLQAVLVFKRARGSSSGKGTGFGSSSSGSSSGGFTRGQSLGSGSTTTGSGAPSFGPTTGTSSSVGGTGKPGTNASLGTTGGASSLGGPDKTLQVFSLKHANAADLAVVLQKVYERNGVEIVPEPVSNKLLVRAPNLETIQELAKLLQELDVPSGRKADRP